jgi:glycosyltransferase involved in cell wall biosynthesis
LEKAQALGLDPAKAQVIRPAVDANFFQPPESSRVHDGTFLVITTGSLAWVKGLEYALLAVRQLKDDGVPISFEIIGDGPERGRVLFTIHDLGLQDCVSLAGRLPPPQVRERLQQADVFVLSSLSEGISNALLEAMACGLPVVTTDCGGMREAVTHGMEGFVTPVRDAMAMALALRTLYEDPSLRQQMGQKGRQRIVQDFNARDQIQQWMKFYRGLQSIRSTNLVSDVFQHVNDLY